MPLNAGSPPPISKGPTPTPRSVATQAPPAPSYPPVATPPPTSYLPPGYSSASPAVQQALAAQAPALAQLNQTSKENLADSLAAQQTAGASALALSQILSGIAPAVSHDYTQAAGADAAFAKGFSTGLAHIQQQTQGEAGGILNLSGGQAQAPQVGAQIGGENVTGPLGYLTGYLPATNLRAEGLAFTEAARNLPVQALGIGQQQQQQARNDLVAAQQKVSDQRATLAAQLPGLIQTAQARIDTKQQAAANAAATAAYRAAQLQLAHDRLAQPHFFNSGGATYAYDPSSGTVKQVTQAAPVYFTDAFGRRTRQNADGSQTVLSAGKMSGPGGSVMEVGTDGKISTLVAGKPVSTRTQVVKRSDGQYLINMDTGATIARVGDLPPTAARRPLAPSVAAGTAVTRLDPSRSEINGVKSDQYGNWINYGTKAKPRYSLVKGWKWGKGMQPVYVGTATTKASTKAYTIPSGVVGRAETLALAVRTGGGSSNPAYAALGLTAPPTTAPGNWGEAFRRVSAYVRGATRGQRVSASDINSVVTDALIAAGYPTPVRKPVIGAINEGPPPAGGAIPSGYTPGMG